MKRQANPPLSPSGEFALAQYEQTLREQKDLTGASVRNYLSDIRHFIAWYEACRAEREASAQTNGSFDPQAITTPALTGYRCYLQTIQRQITGKRNKYRKVPLNATARLVLEEYLPTLPPDGAFLFPSGKTKQALSERALGYLVKKYASAAKLPDVRPHDLRHRFGYRMAGSVPLHRLAQIMGHDSLDTTKLYIQGTKHDLQQAVETIAWT